MQHVAGAGRAEHRSVEAGLPLVADFAATLRRFRLRSGLSQNALAGIAGINASYVNRLERGEREAPTRQVACGLARALALSAEEVDCLLVSAGHAPPSLQKLGPTDSTITAVTRLLTDDRLSPETRADFRAVVETIASRWQGQHSRPQACNDAPSTNGHAPHLSPPKRVW